MFAIDPVFFADVFSESPGRELFFLISQPGGRSWKIRDDEDGNDSDKYLCEVSVQWGGLGPEDLQ